MDKLHSSLARMNFDKKNIYKVKNLIYTGIHSGNKSLEAPSKKERKKIVQLIKNLNFRYHQNCLYIVQYLRVKRGNTYSIFKGKEGKKNIKKFRERKKTVFYTRIDIEKLFRILYAGEPGRNNPGEWSERI